MFLMDEVTQQTYSIISKTTNLQFTRKTILQNDPNSPTLKWKS